MDSTKQTQREFFTSSIDTISKDLGSASPESAQLDVRPEIEFSGEEQAKQHKEAIENLILEKERAVRRAEVVEQSLRDLNDMHDAHAAKQDARLKRMENMVTELVQMEMARRSVRRFRR